MESAGKMSTNHSHTILTPGGRESGFRLKFNQKIAFALEGAFPTIVTHPGTEIPPSVAYNATPKSFAGS